MASSASASTSVSATSVLYWTPEKLNGFKLRRLIIDGGTTAMRNIVLKCHPGKTIEKILTDEKHKLDPLKIGSKSKGKKVINQTQWDVLFPNPPNIPNINNFDITLLSILLRNICGLTTPATGWDEMPNASDNSDVANIIRIKLFRNEVHAHISETGVSTTDFEDYWKKISSAIVSLGINKAEIDSLKNEECGEEVKERVMNEWNEMKDDIKSDLKKALKCLDRIEQGQKVNTEHLKSNKRRLADLEKQQKRFKSSEKRQVKKDKVLEKLACCYFTSERKILCDKFVEGTREWVFKQVEDWFNDDSSKNRAFIITGEAGMGKSVIAAKICERMNQQLAGCHFFNHDNIRYCDPKIFLQSLAFQLSSILPEYKNALVDHLSRNIGIKSINEMDIKGLFTLLLKEPFNKVSDPGKKFLFVIDGVDESCDSHARSDLVDLIATHLVKLPKFIRLLITTRPEKNIVDKFEPLNPFILKKTDQNNVKDLQTFFKSKLLLRNASTDIFQELTSRSDGNMLYAFYLFEVFMEKNSLEDLNNLAAGLTRVFEMYFKRLETECKTVLGITDDAFLSLLSAMVASREPLPLDFVVSIFSIKKDTASAKRNAVLAMNCISLLFVIKDNRVSFFHKSVKDWLVSEKDHIYKIDEKYGHIVLANLCAECFDNVLKWTDLDQSKLTDLEMYTLRNGFYHMIKDEANIVSHVNSYLGNFELIYRCTISVDHFKGWLNYLSEMISDSQYKGKLNELNKYIGDLRVVLVSHEKQFFECSILQCLIVRGHDQIKSKALELHARFFPSRPYFEKVSENDENVNQETIALFPRKEEKYIFAKERSELSSDEESSELSSDEESSELSLAEKTTETCSMKNKLSSADVRDVFDNVVLCFQSGVVVLISIEPFKVIWRKTLPEEEILCSCIVFHPHHDVILPGRLDQVLSLTDGSWQPGPFVCHKNYFFTECCFSPDNSIMITGNDRDEYLILWDLVGGENKRRIELGGHVCSCSFSPNGNYLGVLKADQMSDIELGNQILVFDVTTNYTLLHSVNTSSWNIPLTGFKLCTWIISHDYDWCTQLFSHKFQVPSLLESSGKEHLFFPPSTKAHEFAITSNASQIMPGQQYFIDFLIETEFKCTIVLSDMLHLNIAGLDNRAGPELTLVRDKFTVSNISFDGEYLYQHCQSSRILSILKRHGTSCISVNREVENVIAFAVVNNGVFITTAQGVLEIWNIEMSECLRSCQLLNAIECCESVSDYLIACVGKTEVSFIDSRNLKVVSTTSVLENQLVLACSSKCDVLVRDCSFDNDNCFIIRDNRITLSVLDINDFKFARFSPNASKLVFYSNYQTQYRYCEISENPFRMVVDVLRCPYDDPELIYFLDDEYFIILMGDRLYLTCAQSEEIVSMFFPSYKPMSMFYCNETLTLIVNCRNGSFEAFRLNWPKN